MHVLLALLLAAWPADTANLLQPDLSSLPQAWKVRVFVDAGHGAPNNVGNRGCYCQEEQVHTLAVAKFLAAALAATGRFEVSVSRDGTETPRYQARLAAARAWRADLIISLHSDARGHAFPVRQASGEVCWENPDAPGFSVLWNDEGPAFPAREGLGRALGARLREAGFLAYHGEDYAQLYRQDAVEPSGWIDKRPKKKRVYFLRGSAIPTAIIETHHALDVDEVARWNEKRTLEVFSSAVAAAILDFSTARRQGADSPPICRRSLGASRAATSALLAPCR